MSKKKRIEEIQSPSSLKAKLEPVSRDTAKRSKTEKTLQELKDLYRAVMDNTHFGFSLIDVNYKIIMVNRMICRYFHKPASELIGRVCFREYEKRDSVCPHCPGKIAMATGMPAEAETKGILDDGNAILVSIQAFPAFNSNGKVTGFIEIVQDITKQKKAEEKLRESEEKYRDIFENAREVIITLDLKGKITNINKMVEEYGFNKEELIGKNHFDFIPDQYKAQAFEDFKKTSRGYIDEGEIELFTPRGNIIVEYRQNPIRSGEKIVGIQIITIDITERKKAEEKLRESNEKYRSVIENANIGIGVIQDNQLVFHNNKMCSMLGHTDEELSNIDYTSLIHSEDRPYILDRVRRRLAGDLTKQELVKFRVLSKSGQIKWVESNSTMIQWEGKPAIQAFVTDITERKKAEEKLQQSENLVHQIINATPNPIFAKDRDGRYMFVNKANANLHCTTPEEMVGKTDFDYARLSLASKQEVERFLADDRMVIDSKKTKFIPEETFTLPDGTIKWFQTTKIPLAIPGNPDCVLGVTVDITKHKKVEEALRESKERYRAIFEQAPDSIVLFDANTGIIIDFNNKAHEKLGYSREEFKKLKLSDIDALEPKQEIRKHVTMVVNEGVDTFETKQRTKSGEIRDILVNAKVISLSGRDVIQGIWSDITELKRKEEALRDSKEKFRSIFELSPCSTVLLDLKGNIQQCNRQFVNYHATKEPAEAQVGRNISEFFPPEEVQHLFDTIKKTIKEKKTIIGPTIYTMLKEDGSSFQGEGFSIVMMDVNGKPKGILGLAYDITERQKSEQKLRDYQMQLKSLASELTLAEERERRHIAVELHDQIAQSLVISKIKLDTLRSSAPSRDLVKELEAISDILYKTIQDIQSLTFDLSFPVLYELGFEAAVASWLVEQIQGKYGITSEFEDDKQDKPLDKDVCILLFRNVRELLINVVKHANASKVKVSIRKIDNRIQVSVEDDGVGFDVAKVVSSSAKGGGFGFFSIRERLEELGGQIDINSQSGHGTKIKLMAPLKQQNAKQGQK